MDKTYKERYQELRQTYFTPERFKKYFSDYFTLFRSTGAWEREKARWSGVNGIELDIDAEEQYIYNWIDRRFAFMDKKYGDNPAGIHDIMVKKDNPSRSYKCVINNRIVIVRNGKMYNLQGQEIK